MSDQNMTRRDAVKLSGAALATAGLSAAASPAPAAPTPSPSANYPDFRGKIVAFYTRAKDRNHHMLSDPVFAMQGGRLFVTGTVAVIGCWTDGMSVGFPWDSVESYYVYESVEDYRARCQTYKNTKEAKAEAAAPAEQPHE